MNTVPAQRGNRARLPSRAWVAWAVAAVGVAATLVNVVTAVAVLGVVDPVFIVISVLLGTGLLVVGAFLITRRAENVIGPIMLVSGVATVVAFIGGPYVLLDRRLGGDVLPAATAVAWLSEWAFTPTIVGLGIFVPLLYPTGRLLGPRWRPVLIGAFVLMVCVATQIAFRPGILSAGDLGIPNPFVLPAPFRNLPQALESITTPLAPLFFALAIASVLIRFRRAGGLERAQLKWFLLVASIVAVAFVPAIVDSPLADIAWPVGIAALAMLPIAIGIAILRYRLYDIDRIISRTLAYAILTALLAVVYVGAFVSIGALLSSLTSGGTISVAASTLAAFAVFQPARRRLQTAMDRRFNRSRYDAAATVESFAGRLRNQLDVSALAAELNGTAAASLLPSTTSVWIRGRNVSRTTDG